MILTQQERVQFARGVLEGLEAPTSNKNIGFLLSWMDQENTKADWNPLATTLSYGQTTNFNSAGVKNYETMEQGVIAQVKTLKSNHYPTLLAGLRKDSPETAVNGALETKIYTGEEAYFHRIIAGAKKYDNSYLTVDDGRSNTAGSVNSKSSPIIVDNTFHLDHPYDKDKSLFQNFGQQTREALYNLEKVSVTNSNPQLLRKAISRGPLKKLLRQVNNSSYSIG